MSKNTTNNPVTSYNFTDCKPLEILTAKETLALEYKYQQLLSNSGFKDVEKWDNRPKRKVKKLRFIRGHNRSEGLLDRYTRGVNRERQEFYRVIGIFAYNSPNVSAKYRDVLQDLSLTGNIAQSIRNTKSPYKVDTIQKYVHYNISKMIKFVKEEFSDD